MDYRQERSVNQKGGVSDFMVFFRPWVRRTFDGMAISRWRLRFAIFLVILSRPPVTPHSINRGWLEEVRQYRSDKVDFDTPLIHYCYTLYCCMKIKIICELFYYSVATLLTLLLNHCFPFLSGNVDHSGNSIIEGFYNS